MIRSELRFQSLDEVRCDVEKLLRDGYSKNGKWDLSQISEHLADWLSYPMDGFPPMPWFVKGVLGVMRVFRGKAMYRKFVTDQRMAIGSPTAPQSIHPPNGNSGESVQRLVKEMNRFQNFQGHLNPSPLFGVLSKDELIALQLAHCAHHLRFLSPLQN